MRFFIAGALLLLNFSANAAQDFLVKSQGDISATIERLKTITPKGSQIEDLKVMGWVHVKLPKNSITPLDFMVLSKDPAIQSVQANQRLRILQNPGLAQAQLPAQLKALDFGQPSGLVDNPDIPTEPQRGTGSDPLLNKQWGMKDIGVQEAWKRTRGSQQVVVAVLDTGVDYTHEDLVENLWRNPGESGVDSQGRDKSTNGIDDDNNGFVDDLVGWDFVSNDNKPYDLSVSMIDLFNGGNPGHGTHCAGNVAASGNNGKGISGVAQNVQIMILRFLSEKGGGTTADAIKSIRYAIDNGAHILSNSWGSVGESDNAAENEALKDAIRYSEQKDRLFVAAAGNGHRGVGYDNDSDARPAYPASYDMDVIVSVAALDVKDELGGFSNWGLKSVDLGAPGVNVFSTTADGKYNDKVINIGGLVVSWDGTSMATPHVAGAAALYKSLHPQATFKEIKEALIQSAQKIPALSGKSVSGGKLDVEALIK